MESLYKIKKELFDALNNLSPNEETGEVDTSVLDAIEEKFSDKAENIALYIKDTVALIGNIKEEIASLAERKKAYENKVEWLKDYLGESLTAIGKDKFETAKCSISFRKSESINLTDTSAIPTIFTSTVTEIKIDKTAIKKAIKSGQAVPGAELVTNNNIQIK